MPFIAQLFILSGLLACLRKWTGMAAEEKERERMVKKRTKCVRLQRTCSIAGRHSNV